jgi:hypothetical protein
VQADHLGFFSSLSATRLHCDAPCASQRRVPRLQGALAAYVRSDISPVASTEAGEGGEGGAGERARIPASPALPPSGRRSSESRGRPAPGVMMAKAPQWLPRAALNGQKLSLAIDCCQPCLTSELRSLVVADGLFESRQSDLLPTAHLALRAQAYDASTLRGGDQ